MALINKLIILGSVAGVNFSKNTFEFIFGLNIVFLLNFGNADLWIDNPWLSSVAIG